MDIKALCGMAGRHIWNKTTVPWRCEFCGKRRQPRGRSKKNRSK